MVVQSSGVAVAIPAAVATASQILVTRVRVRRHTTPISIIDAPIVFSTSTRSKSVHGAQGCPRRNSCTRKSRPRPKISAPRMIVVFATSLDERFF